MVAFGQILEGFAVRRKRKPASVCGALTGSAGARALDAEASAEWGLDPFALVEAAGRACAIEFLNFFRKESPNIVVLAGSGNNAADALVMLRALILSGYAQQSGCLVFLTKMPEDHLPAGGKSPLSQALLSVQKIGVAAAQWESAKKPLLGDADVIIDGISGTGLNTPLRGAALEMAQAVNALQERQNRPFVVSIDLPSGCFDGWRPGMPVIAADATLAIEPQKLCLYTPATRIHAGHIIPVGGIFPPALIGQHREAELVSWENVCALIPPVAEDAYKYERGVVEIRAGSAPAAGAARLAAWGAQAAGAGLVRLIVDPSLYPVIAPACSGVMVIPDGETPADDRFSPAAALLGPGWGKGEDRRRQLESYLPLEERGLPLILDADAIHLAKDIVFHGNALLTPHPGEFASYTGLSKEEILADPIPVLRRFAAGKNVVILFKSHVLYAASPDGRIGIIDGMNPALGAGGTGDVLAGFCASIAARWRATAARWRATAARAGRQSGGFDGYTCACAAASLLVRAAHSIADRFADPAEVADAAASVAGAAWLPRGKR